MSYNEQIAELVSKAIEASPYSVKYVSEQSAIAYQTLRRKLRGGSGLTVLEIHKIAKVLGVPMSSFIPEDQEAEDTQAA